MKQATLSRIWQQAAGQKNGDSDDDDQFLVQAMDDTLAALDPPCGSPLEELPGFDVTAGRTWIYPTNYPCREYQFNIVKSCLYHNTLVILPTGLGKTFIAAVAMYNFYRWYPCGKIIFTAPTKPLVAQQIEACFNIMGIPLEDTVEMTGTMQAEHRKKAWREKRVFFLTPQVMANDLLRGACPPKDVKCVVIDEAHKALGNYAYCQMVSELMKYTREFRVIALSATPGSDITAVQKVLKNLMISHVELRTEESLDIQKYTQERSIEKVVVPLGQQLGSVRDRFLGVMRVYLQRLSAHRAMPCVDPDTLGKFRVLKMKEAFQANPPVEMTKAIFSQLQADFGLLVSLYHAYELLLAHGLRSFRNFLKGILDGDKSNPRVRYELLRNAAFGELFSELQEMLGASINQTLSPGALSQNQTIMENGNEVYGHPKLAKLEEIVLEHFRKFTNDTRVMIFSQYRDSVKEITALLNRHRPLLKAMNFVGQNSSTIKGFTQKQQIMVVKKFREGGYNTLVSTCVGEEGLDIGDIDLIVCYDAPKSPIRLVQRMGRTGRKRQGRIVILLTQGKEEQAYRQSNYKKQSIHRAISSGAQFKNLYNDAPRMVPRGLNPACLRMHMTVPAYHSDKGKITAMLPAKGKTVLTVKEQLYYEAHFELPHPEWHSSQPRFLSLGNRWSEPHDRRPSLNSWTPWQNTLQPTFKVNHSAKAKAYVHIMQVIDGLRLAGAEPYELAMKAHLRLEDVHEGDDVQPEVVAECMNENQIYKKKKRVITDFFDDDFQGMPRITKKDTVDRTSQETKPKVSLKDPPHKMRTLEMLFCIDEEKEDDETYSIHIRTPPSLEDSVFSEQDVDEASRMLSDTENGLIAEVVSLASCSPIGAEHQAEDNDMVPPVESQVVPPIELQIHEAGPRECMFPEPRTVSSNVGGVMHAVNESWDYPFLDDWVDSSLLEDGTENRKNQSALDSPVRHSSPRGKSVMSHSTPIIPRRQNSSKPLPPKKDSGGSSDLFRQVPQESLCTSSTRFCNSIDSRSASRSRQDIDFDLEVDLGDWDDEEIVPSPETTHVTPLVSPTKLPTVISSDDEGCIGKSSPVTIQSSDSDGPSHKRKRKVINRLMSSDDEAQEECSKKKKVSRKRAPCEFLDVEAEVSSDDSGDDSDGSSLDSLDGSFIDDEEETSSPMKALYMQSTKSFVHPGRFKIGYQARPSNDVYSQVVSQDISDYLQDSFCVNEEESPVAPKRRKRRRKKPRRRLLAALEEKSMLHSINESEEASGMAVKKDSSEGVESKVPGETTLALSRGARQGFLQQKDAEEQRCLSKSAETVGTDEGSTLVIVDTRVIASCPALVSELRLQPGLAVQVQSLSVGDFQLSLRMGVICLPHLADRDLLQQVRHLFELYDRPCIILEHDPEERSIKKKRSFYMTLLQLVSTHAKVLLSTSQDNTVDILATLARQEARKGMAIPALPQVKELEEVVPFYLALPKVNLGVAISLAAGYRSITQFLQSTAEEIQRIGKVSDRRSQEIFSFCCKSSSF